MKIVKLTEKQIQEAETNTFKYLGGGDVKSNNGQSEISASGKISDNEYGVPVTTDNIANKITPNSYNRYTTYNYSNIRNIKEGFNDKDNDNIDDFYDNKDIETLSDNDNSNNLTRIPKGVENKLDALLFQIENNSLTSKQKAIILFNLIDKLNIYNLPISWKKNLILKINSSKNDTHNL